MVDLCRSLPVDYSIACHTADPPLECVREAAAAGASEGRGRFLGVVFDELEHARLINNYASEPLADFARFESLPQAYEETLAGLERLSAKFAGADAPVVATHIFPVLLHPAARAGFHVCPKICKELYSPVSLAIGMGAAKQYDRELWADCDLWFWDLLPGHSPEELRSNLLLAYWLGADRVYVEGAGFNLKPVGKQGIPFSLLTLIDQETYQLTPHGEALRAFVPSSRRLAMSLVIGISLDFNHKSRFSFCQPSIVSLTNRAARTRRRADGGFFPSNLT